MTQVRTRFAPSPTGYLHIGGARTAIFNWLYARRHGGQFVLRIEDTDLERSTEDSIQQIIDAMNWLGIDYDEGPFRQMDRQAIYNEYIAKLFEKKQAYRCVCSKEELDRKREEAQKAGKKPKYDGTCRGKNIPADCGQPFVVRIATPGGGVTRIDDMLRGVIAFDNEELDDMILVRTDGTPTYNFCVVVDDVDMRISHVIRGDDHLANTPRQMIIYNALGLTPPKFAHVSMILGKDKARLSKRHGAMSVLDYREKGILPDAMVNYLTRLGWSHGDSEVFTRDELKSLFDLDAVGKSAACFDEDKLTWINAEKIKTESEETLAPLAMEFLSAKGISADKGQVVKILPMLRQRARTVKDLAEGMLWFFADSVSYDPTAVKHLAPSIAPVLSTLGDRLENADFASPESVEAVFKALLEERGLKLKDLAQPVRVALTGGTVSPGLFEMMIALGKEKCVERIRKAAQTAQAEGVAK
ncbi:MAG: glutamate--tRNA ligase [Nitrospinae bacterium]|nr:glutamate--tRNA ligase [Nitrospinota bacterium]